MSNELHDAVTGEFAKKGSDPAKTTKVEEDRKSPWRKEAERLLDCIEASKQLDVINEYTVALMIHCQVLKRNDL